MKSISYLTAFVRLPFNSGYDRVLIPLVTSQLVAVTAISC